MRILIDIDDTLCDLVSTWLEIYNADYNDNLKRDQILSWDIGSYTKIGHKFYDYLTNPNINLYYAIEPFPYALEGIQLFRKLDYRIVFVTAYDNYNRKWNWLNQHGFTDDMDEYVVAHDKSLIRGELLIDDKYDNIISFDGLGWLYNEPWNQQYMYSPRVNNWQKIMEKIKGF
jgi:5'-nucleotidase